MKFELTVEDGMFVIVPTCKECEKCPSYGFCWMYKITNLVGLLALTHIRFDAETRSISILLEESLKDTTLERALRFITFMAATEFIADGNFKELVLTQISDMPALYGEIVKNGT